MAYTDIPTVSVGDLHTASDFNTYLKDNFGAGIPDKFTAKGDIALGEGADTIGILALGNAGDWLTCDAAETLGVKWAAPTSFFDWFTFGAFTCATLDDTPMPSTMFAYREAISDIHTGFSLPDTTSRIFLGSLTARYTDSDQAAGAVGDNVCLTAYDDSSEVYIFNRVYGEGGASESWMFNTQTGIFRCNTNGALDVNYTTEGAFTVSVKIWGYA